MLEAATDLAAHWGQAAADDPANTVGSPKAELLHGVVDELLDLDAALPEAKFPTYYSARLAVRVLLGRPVSS